MLAVMRPALLPPLPLTLIPLTSLAVISVDPLTFTSPLQPMRKPPILLAAVLPRTVTPETLTGLFCVFRQSPVTASNLSVNTSKPPMRPVRAMFPIAAESVIVTVPPTVRTENPPRSTLARLPTAETPVSDTSPRTLKTKKPPTRPASSLAFPVAELETTWVFVIVTDVAPFMKKAPLRSALLPKNLLPEILTAPTHVLEVPKYAAPASEINVFVPRSERLFFAITLVNVTFGRALPVVFTSPTPSAPRPASSVCCWKTASQPSNTTSVSVMLSRENMQPPLLPTLRP